MWKSSLFLQLDEAIASRAVFVIVSVVDREPDGSPSRRFPVRTIPRHLLDDSPSINRGQSTDVDIQAPNPHLPSDDELEGEF